MVCIATNFLKEILKEANTIIRGREGLSKQ
jgi:hypothetical protein